LAEKGDYEEISTKLAVAQLANTRKCSNEYGVLGRLTQYCDRGWNTLKSGYFAQFLGINSSRNSIFPHTKPNISNIFPHLTMQYPRIPKNLDGIDAVKFNYALLATNSAPIPRPVWPPSDSRTNRSKLNKALRKLGFLSGANRTQSAAVSSPHAIELGTYEDEEGNSVRELILPHAGIFTEGENSNNISQGHAFVQLYSLKDHPAEGEFTAALPKFTSFNPFAVTRSPSPVLVYPDSDAERSTNNRSPLYSPESPSPSVISSQSIGEHSPNKSPMAIDVYQGLDDDIGSEISKDQLKYENRPKPNRTMYPSLPPRRLKSYPTENHPDEAEDTYSVSTDSVISISGVEPIAFVVPPTARSKFDIFPINSTSTQSRYELQQCHSDMEYLRHYGTPSSLPSDVTSPDSSAQLSPREDSDSVPDLESIVDSSDEEADLHWMQTKAWLETEKLKRGRIARVKRRMEMQNRIDEKKRGRLLRVARDNEQESEEGYLDSDQGCGVSYCSPNINADLLSHRVPVPAISDLETHAAHALVTISSSVATPTCDPRVRPTIDHSINVYSPYSPQIYSATLDNERAGLNTILHKSKNHVASIDDFDNQSSTGDEEHDTCITVMNAFIDDALQHRLVDNYRVATPSPWEEDRAAPNKDETHFNVLQRTLDIIISETPASPAPDYISGQLEQFATRIPLYRCYREKLVEALKYVRDCLTQDQWSDAIRDTLNIYKESETRANFYIETLVDRHAWYAKNYPCLNTLFTIRESTFLRGASDTLRRHGRKRFSKSIDHLLNTSIPDREIIGELVSKGYLSSESPNDYEALAYVKCRLEEMGRDLQFRNI